MEANRRNLLTNLTLSSPGNLFFGGWVRALVRALRGRFRKGPFMKALIPIGALGLLALGALQTTASATILDYDFTLTPVNGSGVTGSGTMQLNTSDWALRVTMNVMGLTPNEPHPEHIHGLLGALAPSTTLPPPSADVNHDGFIEVPEAAPFEGPPIFDLPPSGVPHVYSTAPGGVIAFTHTYNLADPAYYDPMGLAPGPITLADVLGTTGGETIPLIDRIVETYGRADVPASV